MDHNKPKPYSGNPLMKYSGMAMQLLVLILLAVWIGKKLDLYFNLERPFITAFMAVFVLIAFFIKLFKDLSKT